MKALLIGLAVIAFTACSTTDPESRSRFDQRIHTMDNIYLGGSQ